MAKNANLAKSKIQNLAKSKNRGKSFDRTKDLGFFIFEAKETFNQLSQKFTKDLTLTHFKPNCYT